MTAAEQEKGIKLPDSGMDPWLIKAGKNNH
jgi:hypothetical protein